MVAWATPKATDGSKDSRTTQGAIAEVARGKGPGLGAMVKAFPTATANDWKGGTATPRKDTGLPRQDRLDHLHEPGADGQLNPDWVEALMGWPIGWSGLEPMPVLEWDYDWSGWEPDIPRVATGVANRKNRLQAIGNGQVPLCMAVAWELLNNQCPPTATPRPRICPLPTAGRSMGGRRNPVAKHSPELQRRG